MRNVFSLLCVLAYACFAYAGNTEMPNDADFSMAEMIAQISVDTGSPHNGNKKKDSPYPEFKKVTDGMVPDKGMFTLWAYPPSNPNKDKEKLLCQIPSSMLGQKFMLSTSLSGGGFMTGFPIDERVVMWKILDRQLLLIEPETRFVVDSSKEIADVVRRTYPDKIRVAVPIVTKSPGGDPVIDFGSLLKSSFADIGWMSFGGINSSLSSWTKKKVFELNVEIGVELAMGGYGPPGSYDKKIVHYSFWKLPPSDYRPRIADDRIGYFLTTNQDWAKPTKSRDIFNRYIDRWHLQKRDPSLAMCEPKQPIIFYIEKTVPVRFRRAVRDGILEWNKAFEKIGFLNAIEVRQQTKDNEWKDLDPEDMRYSFFRWIVNGAGFAMGPHRSNPFTGQIYDADIIFDDGMIRYYEQSAGEMLPATSMFDKAKDPAMASFLEKFPQWKRPTRDWEYLVLEDQGEKELREKMRRHMQKHCCHFCEYADGMKHQMALGQNVLAGLPKEVIDRFLYDVVKEVACHEVGHTLGLRHNFKASTIYSLEEIKQLCLTEEATTGSIMDYNPILFFDSSIEKGHFTTPTIGPYDYWAIEYGYRPYDQNYNSHRNGSSKEELKQEPELAAETNKEKPKPDGVDLSKVPQEILEQIPSEVRDMLASGEFADEPETAEPEENPTPVVIAGERDMLMDIASRSWEPELTYATDEDTTSLSPDPRVNRFDMGSDPIDWAEERMALVDKRLKNILDWAVDEKESWQYVRQAFSSLISEKIIVLDYVGRYIGGQYFDRSHRGENNGATPFELVDPALQRRALAFIENTLFQEKFFELSPELLNHMAPSRWSHQGVYVDYKLDFPIHNMIAFYQGWNLFDRLMPNTLRRIQDAEFKSEAADKFTLAEYIKSLQHSCWKDVLDKKRIESGPWNDSKPFISDTRRSLQREYLSAMEPLVRFAPGYIISSDIQAMLKHSLRQLASELKTIEQMNKADFASQAHMTACVSRIERMLTPELKEVGW